MYSVIKTFLLLVSRESYDYRRKVSKRSKQMLLITNNLYQADKLETDILQYIDHSEVYKYPVQDIMTEEFSTQSPQLMSERKNTDCISS